MEYADMLFERMKRYGINPDSDHKDQHFLISKDVVDAVVDAADLSGKDFVLEIGPGLGQFTEAILQRGARLVSIEIDDSFREIIGDLKTRYADRFDIIWGSALDVSWPAGINKLVMNPPFSILEPLLELIYIQRDIELVSMIIGRRYYESAVQRPGSRGFCKSTLMTQAKFDPKLIMDIKREHFYPLAGERCVAMALTVNRRPNPALRIIADFFVRYPDINVKFVVNQALDLLNRNARKYKKIENLVTAKQVGIEPDILDRRLQDLSNSELAQVVQKLTSRFNFQRKKPKRFSE